jgi:hypothetical protein
LLSDGRLQQWRTGASKGCPGLINLQISTKGRFHDEQRILPSGRGGKGLLPLGRTEDFPAGQVAIATQFGLLHEGIDGVVHDIRPNDGQERILAGEHIPAAENSAIDKIAGRVDSAVGPV